MITDSSGKYYFRYDRTIISLILKDIFIELDELLSKIQADKNSPEIKVNELMNIRNSIHSVREKIIATSEKFSYLQSISLWDFLYSDEIEKALADFSHTEIHLFIRIQEELTIILGDWLLYHQYELNQLDKEISHLSEKEIFGKEVFEIQSARLKTYINGMQKNMKEV